MRKDETVPVVGLLGFSGYDLQQLIYTITGVKCKAVKIQAETPEQLGMFFARESLVHVLVVNTSQLSANKGWASVMFTRTVVLYSEEGDDNLQGLGGSASDVYPFCTNLESLKKVVPLAAALYRY